MIVDSRACFILPFLLVLAPLRLQAADETNKPPTKDDAAAFGTVSPATPEAFDISDFSDISTETITLPGAPRLTPEAEARQTKSFLLHLAARLVEVQHKMPDPKIAAIIDHFGLSDTAALAALSPAATDQLVGRIVFAIDYAAKNDPLAARVTKEFQISSGLPPAPAPAAAPSTNAPSAVST